jgi:eukaryotic translation initiation factor 2-alpha kinase 4
MEPSLLMPASNLDNDNNPLLIDRHGDVVALPDDAIVPFARLAAKREVSRIKRYHIGNTWKAK